MDDVKLTLKELGSNNNHNKNTFTWYFFFFLGHLKLLYNTYLQNRQKYNKVIR